MSSFPKDLMIDTTYIFTLINNLMCLESNAICMFFFVDRQWLVYTYALILLLSKSSTMSDLWLYGFDSWFLYHNFFESKSWEVFKLWYLLFKEVDLVAVFVLFDLQNSSFLSFCLVKWIILFTIHYGDRWVGAAIYM